jgi:hypothetical protein
MQKIEMEPIEPLTTEHQKCQTQVSDKGSSVPNASRNKLAKPLYPSLKDQRSLNNSKIRNGVMAVSSVRNSNKTPIVAVKTQQ